MLINHGFSMMSVSYTHLVYKTNQNLRLLGSHKTGDKRIKRVMDVKRITDSLPTFSQMMRMDDDEADAIRDKYYFTKLKNNADVSFLETLIGSVRGCEVLNPLQLTYKEAKEAKSATLDDDEYASIQDRVLKVCESTGLLENHRFRTRQRGLFIFNRSNSEHCDICERRHDEDNTLYVTVYLKDEYYYVNRSCFRFSREHRGEKKSIRVGSFKKTATQEEELVIVPPKKIEFAVTITEELEKTINDFINTTLKGAFSWDKRKITSSDTIVLPVSDNFKDVSRVCQCCINKSHTNVSGLIKFSEFREERFISFICPDELYIKKENRTRKANYLAITCINANGIPCMSKTQMMSREGMIKMAIEDNKASEYKLFNIDYTSDRSHGLPVECVNLPDIPAIKIAPSIVIVSNKGTSKTIRIIEMIKRLRGKTIVWTTHRISLADNITARLNSENIQTRYYKDINDHKPIKKGEVAIIQADSLKRVIDQSSMIDVFIIDELLSVSARMCNPDEKINKSVQVYFKLMRTASVVVYSDAYLDRSLFESVVSPAIDRQKQILAKRKQDKDTIRYESPSYILQNEYKRQTDAKVCITTNHIDVFTKMCEDLDQGARFTCSSTSLADLTTIYNALVKKYPNKKDKIALITGNSEKEFKKVMSEYVNQSWIQYDVILYTSVISAGVSFEVAGHFKRLYSIITRRSCLIQEAAQSFSRVRMPMMKEITILVKINSEKQEDIKDVDVYQEKHIDDLIRVYPNRIWELDNFTRLQACFMRYRDITDKQLLRSLLFLLEIDGTTDIQTMQEKKGDKQLNKAFIKKNRQTDDDLITDLSNAVQIAGGDFSELITRMQMGHTLQKEESLAMYKYRIQNYLSCEQSSIPINKESYKIYKNKSQSRPIRAKRGYSPVIDEDTLRCIQQERLIDVEHNEWELQCLGGKIYESVAHHGPENIEKRCQMSNKARSTLSTKQDIRLSNTMKNFDISLIIASNRAIDRLGFTNRDLSAKRPVIQLDRMKVADIVNTYNEFHESTMQVTEQDDQTTLTGYLEKVLKDVYALKLIVDNNEYSFHVDTPNGWEYDLFTFEYRLKPVIVAPVVLKPETIERYERQANKEAGIVNNKQYELVISDDDNTFYILGKYSKNKERKILTVRSAKDNTAKSVELDEEYKRGLCRPGKPNRTYKKP